ncbi:hypothetical protein HOD20_09555 [archaeon]|jgi:ABC-type multidrug transport system fused ATPase/permease subunit|nr:hypothetical protein [archaeon]MBT4352755.1 hypothetical protein [archaeon]MBT4648158.1 hypothetical protein [archaeon]MBT6822424.1 hypothetical protein [archaeon]MBT7391893.1 hypothetical protein [archaeon]
MVNKINEIINFRTKRALILVIIISIIYLVAKFGEKYLSNYKLNIEEFTLVVIIINLTIILLIELLITVYKFKRINSKLKKKYPNKFKYFNEYNFSISYIKNINYFNQTTYLNNWKRRIEYYEFLNNNPKLQEDYKKIKKYQIFLIITFVALIILMFYYATNIMFPSKL